MLLPILRPHINKKNKSENKRNKKKEIQKFEKVVNIYIRT
jgi:hypothetical protein